MTGRSAPDDAGGGERPDRRVADGRRHDRQVLVAGDSPAAVAAAGFLDQVGFDPVLTAPPTDRLQPDTLTLWRPGLALLERLGLRRAVERVGTRVDRLDRPTTGASWDAAPPSRPALVSIRRATLQRQLDRRVRERVRTVDRPLATIDRTPDRLTARFADGIEEPFDTVITTDPTLVPAAVPRHEAATIHAWAFDWPAEPAVPAAPMELWATGTAAFTMPVAGETRVQLVATTAPTEAVLDPEVLDQRFGALFAATSSPFGSLAQHTVQYQQVPLVVPKSLHTDGIGLIGPATRASVPGDCLRTTLGLEDAWVVADALAYGPAARDDALAAYERRRRRRDRAVRQAPTARSPASISPLLSPVRAMRSLAFRHVTAGELPEIAEAIPTSG